MPHGSGVTVCEALYSFDMDRVFVRGLGGVKAAAALVGLLLVCACSSAPISGPRGDGWVAVPELSDEFEGGALDTTKWHDHNPSWLGRAPALFARRNVAVRNGRLQLTARAEEVRDAPPGFHSFTTAAVKSKTTIKYGYFEVKARPMKARISSGFWFYNDTEREWTEIDVFEICGTGADCTYTQHMHVHVFRAPNETRHWSMGGTWRAPFDLIEEDHVYGLAWDERFIRWYVDGRLIREQANTHWHQPLYLNLDAETQPDWFGLPSVDDLPATFSIEYVRAWKRTGNDRR